MVRGFFFPAASVVYVGTSHFDSFLSCLNKVLGWVLMKGLVCWILNLRGSEGVGAEAEQRNGDDGE